MAIGAFAAAFVERFNFSAPRIKSCHPDMLPVNFLFSKPPSNTLLLCVA
jgi:hypothetical protein